MRVISLLKREERPPLTNIYRNVCFVSKLAFMDVSGSHVGKPTVRWNLLRRVICRGSPWNLQLWKGATEAGVGRGDVKNAIPIIASAHSMERALELEQTFSIIGQLDQDSVCLHWWTIGCWASREGGIASAVTLCNEAISDIPGSWELFTVSTLQLGQLQWCIPSSIGICVSY